MASQRPLKCSKRLTEGFQRITTVKWAFQLHRRNGPVKTCTTVIIRRIRRIRTSSPSKEVDSYLRSISNSDRHLTQIGQCLSTQEKSRQIDLFLPPPVPTPLKTIGRWRHLANVSLTTCWKRTRFWRKSHRKSPFSLKCVVYMQIYAKINLSRHVVKCLCVANLFFIWSVNAI